MPKTISNSDSALIAHLKDISTWVSSVQDLDKLLELIIESAARVMQVKAASLLMVDPRSKTLFFQVATGEKSDEVKEYRIKMGQGGGGGGHCGTRRSNRPIPSDRRCKKRSSLVQRD